MRSRSRSTPGPVILLLGPALAGCGPSLTGAVPETVKAAERPLIPRVTLYGHDLPAGLTARPERDWTVPGEPLFEDQPRDLTRIGQARSVHLSLLVDAAGRVRSTEVVESSRSTAVTAVDARAAEIARSWRFSPARNGTVPVGVRIDDVRIEWPLIIVDGILRPGIEAAELRNLDIWSVDICKGSVCGPSFGAPWARSGVIDITTRVGHSRR